MLIGFHQCYTCASLIVIRGRGWDESQAPLLLQDGVGMDGGSERNGLQSIFMLLLPLGRKLGTQRTKRSWSQSWAAGPSRAHISLLTLQPAARHAVPSLRLPASCETYTSTTFPLISVILSYLSSKLMLHPNISPAKFDSISLGFVAEPPSVRLLKFSLSPWRILVLFTFCWWFLFQPSPSAGFNRISLVQSDGQEKENSSFNFNEGLSHLIRLLQCSKLLPVNGAIETTGTFSLATHRVVQDKLNLAF